MDPRSHRIGGVGVCFTTDFGVRYVLNLLGLGEGKVTMEPLASEASKLQETAQSLRVEAPSYRLPGSQHTVTISSQVSPADAQTLVAFFPYVDVLNCEICPRLALYPRPGMGIAKFRKGHYSRESSCGLHGRTIRK